MTVGQWGPAGQTYRSLLDIADRIAAGHKPMLNQFLPEIQAVSQETAINAERKYMTP
ncbi:hypothetical protein SO078_06180 [Sinorhizobium meliloti]|jgi:hypothetical protein|uniref:hypothetical protein n=1 Tax=Rhizobium meliloti TaxID=382 RepID=UPI002D79FA46|nr:hypothetical protein [Sinorhizobium meliloti]WRQ68809.1 hypothetical protein SO078_06180 [Sinorhizobium meliloti]